MTKHLTVCYAQRFANRECIVNHTRNTSTRHNIVKEAVNRIRGEEL